MTVLPVRVGERELDVKVPTSAELPSVASRVHRASELLSAWGPGAADLIRQWTLDMSPSPPEAGATSGGDPSNPTLAAVLRPEAISHKGLTLLEWAALADEASMAATSIVEAAREAMADPDTKERPPLRESTVPSCVEKHCEDPVLPGEGREGRCPPCAQWRRRWREAHGGEPPPPVPKSVIDARVEARRKRRPDPDEEVHEDA